MKCDNCGQESQELFAVKGISLCWDCADEKTKELYLSWLSRHILGQLRSGQARANSNREAVKHAASN